jgi:hypothetical protein
MIINFGFLANLGVLDSVKVYFGDFGPPLDGLLEPSHIDFRT